MNYVKRNHPRVYKKKQEEVKNKEKENVITLSGATALGLLALSFVEGVFWGFMLKRKLH